MALIVFGFTKADVGAMRSIGQSGLNPAFRAQKAHPYRRATHLEMNGAQRMMKTMRIR